MSRRKLKARDKVTHKMTKDGVALRNLTTGEDIRISKREADFSLRSGEGEQDSISGRGNNSVGKKSKRHKSKYTDKPKQAENAATVENTLQTADVVSDTSRQPDMPAVSQQTESDKPQENRQEEISRPADTQRISQWLPSAKSKPLPKIADTPVLPPKTQNATGVAEVAEISVQKPFTEQGERQSEPPQGKLRHDEPDKLKFSKEEAAPDTPKKQKPQKRGQSQSQSAIPPVSENRAEVAEPVETSDVPLKHTKGELPLNHGNHGRLHFDTNTNTDMATANIPKPKRQQPTKQEVLPINETEASEQSATPPISANKPLTNEPLDAPVAADMPEIQATVETKDSPAVVAESEIPTESEMPAVGDTPESALKTDKPGKLKFNKDEAAPDAPKNRKLDKAQKQADRSVKKLEKAQGKLPSKKKLRSKIIVDWQSGKPKRKLYFENEVKSQSAHLKGALPLRPVKMAGNSAIAYGHRRIFQVERENVATEAAHKGEMAAEGVVRSALRHHKTAPYTKAAKLERTAQKKAVNLTYQKTLSENPKLKSNMLSRAFQKRKIKKDYAKAAREAQKAAKRAKQTGSAVSNAGKAVVGVVKRHPLASAAVVIVALLLFSLMSLVGVFGGAGSGGLGSILSASYLAEDADIDNAELSYTGWETDLQMQIASAETSLPGYNEYRYNIGDISHNPYELMAYLTAKYQNFNSATAQAELAALFAEQYTLTFTPNVEVRYADPSDSDDDGDYMPYDWNVLTVTLTAKSFTDVVSGRMNSEELGRYAILMQTKGSRQYVGNPFDFEWLSRVTSYYGYRVHPISGAKDYHKGVDIAVPVGTGIHAGQDGTVTTAAYDAGGYGYYIVIEDDKGLVSKYAHLDELLASEGQTVKIGDIIAKSGNTGNSTGAHLHLEVMKNGQYLNPAIFADTGNFDLIPTYGDPGTPMGDGTYAALIAEAELYLGYPYVWSGSSPSTSFDCSGYVSWVLTHSGVKNTGRLAANDLYNIGTPVSPTDARPGDLIAFHSTYSTPKPVSHIGIYVGEINGVCTMIHCGNPVQYTSIETAYWQAHFYGFSRISK